MPHKMMKPMSRKKKKPQDADDQMDVSASGKKVKGKKLRRAVQGY